jgi:hypothetical protein
MTPKPLDILKKDFTKLSSKIKVRMDELNVKISWRETISLSDKQ